MWLFTAARVWLVVANGAALAFSLGVAALYAYIPTDEFISLNITQLQPNILEFFDSTWIGAACIAVGHVLTLLYLFKTRCSTSHERSGMTSVHPQPLERQLSSAMPPSGRLRLVRESVLRQKRRFLWSWTAYAAEITRLFMVWEVMMQTFQANKVSHLVASKAINRLIALVIVANCWFSPILHRAMNGRTSALVRLCRLLIDSLLDVLYTVMIPVSIFYPYYRDYDGGISVFPATYYHRDVWYINAISELRQVLVTSWIDALSKGTASLSLVYRLFRIARALGVVEAEQESKQPGAPTRAILTLSTHSRLIRFSDYMLLLWGAAVLSLHSHALVNASLKHDAGCLLEMQPWASSRYSCASLEISCTVKGIEGGRNAIHASVAGVNPLSIQGLIISHCVNFEMPTTIRSLSSLTMLKIYNSTIASWGHDAALSSSAHPLLRVLLFPRVNMSRIPDGLLASDFPTTVWEIIFSITNVTDFPPQIAHAWQSAALIIVEGNDALTEIPRALTALPTLPMLLVRVSNISAIDDQAFANMSLYAMVLDSCPINHLPASVGSLDRLSVLSFIDTNITDVPASWMVMPPPPNPAQHAVLIASGSPLCITYAENPLAIAKPDWLLIDCVQRHFVGTYAYPIPEEDEWRQHSARV